MSYWTCAKSGPQSRRRTYQVEYRWIHDAYPVANLKRECARLEAMARTVPDPRLRLRILRSVQRVREDMKREGVFV